MTAARKLNKTLRRIFFTVAIAGAALGVEHGIDYGVQRSRDAAQNLADKTEDARNVQRLPKGKPDSLLTKGERAFIKSVFGAEIDTRFIRKHFVAADTANAAFVSDSSKTEISFCGPANYSTDYSRDTSFLYGTFIHEVLHLLQNQENWKGVNGACGEEEKSYHYSLTDAYSFKDYCEEQQAAIVEDYAKRFLHPDRAAPGYLCVAPDAHTDSLLKKVVGTRFPAARATRLAMEAQEAQALELLLPQVFFGKNPLAPKPPFLFAGKR